eukprot:jgi/Chrzof1/10756/Cz05g11030.t1
MQPFRLVAARLLGVVAPVWPGHQPQRLLYEFNAPGDRHETERVFQSGETAVERLTLQHVLPNALAVLGNLLTVVELQEPTFKEVIVMYRDRYHRHHHDVSLSPQASSSSFGLKATVHSIKATAGAIAQGWSGKDTHKTNVSYEHNIHIKAFNNVPIADLEMVFPHKQASVCLITGCRTRKISAASAVIYCLSIIK